MKRSRLPNALNGLIVATAAALLFSTFSCTTAPATRTTAAQSQSAAAAPGPSTVAEIPLTSEEALFRSQDLNPYARENAASFKSYILSNGIPLIFKENRNNRVFALRLVLRGHTVFTPPERAGIEAVTLAMLTKGSRDYPYEELRKLLYEKTSAIGPSFGSTDLTSFGLTTLSKYVPELLGAFTDSFLHPRWDSDRFDEVMNDFKVGKQRDDNDPYALSLATLEKHLFAGHPYYASWNGVDDSLSHITLDDVVHYYETTIVPSRIFIVAVGDFDPDRLYRLLDTSIGQMTGAKLEVPPPPSFALNVRRELVTRAFPESRGLAYLQGGFVLPPPSSREYPAVLVSLVMLEDLLYDNVRTRHGAAYSVTAREYGVAANYGRISIYKTTEPAKVKPYVDEAIRVLASGRCLAARVDSSATGKSGIGSAGEVRDTTAAYVPIADALQFYKDQYVTAFFAGQATNLSIASQIASSIFYHGDYRDYLLLIDRIAGVTPDEISAVAQKYLVESPILWVAVGSQDILSTIDKGAYEGTVN